MSITGGNTTVRQCLEDVRATIQHSDAIPEAKKAKLLRLWDPPPQGSSWTVSELPANSPTMAGLDGVTVRQASGDGTIYINGGIVHGAIVERERLRAVLFHELIHATGEGELDAQVLEILVFRGRGATGPTVEDTGSVVGGRLSSGGHGFSPPSPPAAPDPWAPVVSDHFIWDPRTGKVWKKGENGQRIEPPVIDPSHGDDSAWRRTAALQQPNGHYFIGGLDFDPVRLRLLSASSTAKEPRVIAASPHFVVSLFLDIDHHEQGLMAKRAGFPTSDRLPLPALRQASFPMADEMGAPKRSAARKQTRRKSGRSKRKR